MEGKKISSFTDEDLKNLETSHIEMKNTLLFKEDLLKFPEDSVLLVKEGLLINLRLKVGGKQWYIKDILR